MSERDSAMIEIDGSSFSGSGTIVRQSIAFAALTGLDVHIVNARARRRNPGLRRQHVRAVEAIGELVAAEIDGCGEGSRELTFRPGTAVARPRYTWDIGSAGSTTMLALAVLPVVAFSPAPAEMELIGGVFQDFAPSFFHTEHVLLPLLRKMGVEATAELRRPGYVPMGGGVIALSVQRARPPLQPLDMRERRGIERAWGIALSSKLRERQVSERMAAVASEILTTAGLRPEIETRDDETALQRGAALALFADDASGARLGADRAGALRRSAEAIGRYAAHHLLDDLATGATLDRHAADQIIPYAALADGESRFLIPGQTDHIESGAWLARLFLDAEVRIEGNEMTVRGVGFRGALPAGLAASR